MHAPIAPSGGIGQPRPPQENNSTKRKRKIKKKRQTPTQPRQKKGFQWKKRPTRGSKEKKRKKENNTCRLRTTEETCKPLKILEIALAKKLQRPTQTSREFSWNKFLLTSHQLLTKCVRIHFAMLCGYWFALAFLLCLPCTLVSCQKSDWWDGVLAI